MSQDLLQVVEMRNCWSSSLKYSSSAMKFGKFRGHRMHLKYNFRLIKTNTSAGNSPERGRSPENLVTMQPSDVRARTGCVGGSTQRSPQRPQASGFAGSSSTGAAGASRLDQLHAAFCTEGPMRVLPELSSATFGSEFSSYFGEVPLSNPYFSTGLPMNPGTQISKYTKKPTSLHFNTSKKDRIDETFPKDK